MYRQAQTNGTTRMSVAVHPLPQYRFSVGDTDYLKAASELYERKERCADGNEVGELIDEIRHGVEELESAGTVQGRLTALVLRAQQIDNWYRKSGHSKLCAEDRRRPLVSECQDEAENEATSAQAKFKQLERDVETADERRQSCRVGVWVYGYSAMQKLSAKDLGSADQLLQKALVCIRKIHTSADTDTDAAKRERCLLESGLLNHCFGRFHRDTKTSKRRHSDEGSAVAGVCNCKSRACQYFTRSLDMFKAVVEEMSDGSFSHDVVLMHVNIVRTLLGNPDEILSWGSAINKEILGLCEKHMHEALELNRRSCRESLKDRLNFRLEFFQGYLKFKEAISKSITLSTSNSADLRFNGCRVADAMDAKKAEVNRCVILLGAVVQCFNRCQDKYGEFYNEMRVVPQLLRVIENEQGKLITQRTRFYTSGRRNESGTSDRETSGGQSSSESGARRKRDRNPPFCENQDPSQPKQKTAEKAKVKQRRRNHICSQERNAANLSPTSEEGETPDTNVAVHDQQHVSSPGSCLHETEEPQPALYSST